MVGFSVDGISTTNVFNSAAGTNPYPSPEGIAELKVTAFNNNAEFAQVGDVTFTTKGGTNNFHGVTLRVSAERCTRCSRIQFCREGAEAFQYLWWQHRWASVDSPPL